MYRNILKITFWKAKDTKWIVFMVAFIIMMVSMLDAVSASIEASFLHASYNTSQYDVMIRNLSYEEAQEQIIKTKGEKASYAAIATDDFMLQIPNSYFYVNAIGIEGDYQELYRLEISEGVFPQKEDEIALDYKYNVVANKQCRIGDKIQLQVYVEKTGKYETVEYKICGFYDVPHIGGYELYGLLSLNGGNKLLELMQQEEQYFALIKAKEDTATAMRMLVEGLDEEVRDRRIINSIRYEMLSEKEQDSNQFVQGFKGLGIFIGIASVALLYNMFQVTTVNKIQQLGMLRCLGLNRLQLGNVLFINLLFFVSSSMLLGFLGFLIIEKLFSNFLMHIFLDSFTQGYQYVDVQWHFDIKVFLGSALFILVIMGGVYAGILLKVLRFTPLEALHYKGEKIGKYKVSWKLGKKEKLISFIGRRNLLRNKWRTLYTGFTVFIMSVLIITITIVVSCLDLFNMDALRKSNLFDYEFYEDSIIASVNKECVEEIRELASVGSVCPARRVVYELFQEEEANINSDTFVETRVYSEEVFARICEENDFFYEAGENSPVYFQLSMEDKSTERLVLYDVNHYEKEIFVDAVISKDNYCNYYSTGDSIILVINEAAALELFGEYNYNVLLISSRNKEESVQEINELLVQKGIRMTHDNLKTDTRNARVQLQSIMCIAMYILLCISIMVITNIICNININISLRTQEYGVLRAMGMDKKKIVRLIIFEIVHVTEKAIVIATPCAMLIAAFFITSLGQMLNYVKIFGMAVISAIIIYSVTYGICYNKGHSEFGKNIIQLIRNE